MAVENGSIHTLSALVANKPGVLARIAQVFARRGFNIESLVVSPSKDGAYSRMTIGTSGTEGGLDQILAQVNKLVDVLHCYDHTFDNAVVRELALVKVSVGAQERTEALQIAQHLRLPHRGSDRGVDDRHGHRRHGEDRRPDQDAAEVHHRRDGTHRQGGDGPRRGLHLSPPSTSIRP